MALTHNKILHTSGAFEIYTPLSSGLVLRVRGGNLLTATGITAVQGGDLTLTASTTNYVEVSDAGVVSSNATSFTSGATYLYEVTTSATVVTDVEDWRFSPVRDPTLAVNVSALAAAGLGATHSILKSETATHVVLAANATHARACLVIVTVDEAYVTNTGTQPTVVVGEVGTTNKGIAVTVLASAAAGAVFTGAFLNTANTVINATSVAAVGNATGGCTVTVLALPTT
jgi:hypothetical protein